MTVYVANFGEQNYEWPVCKARGTIATMNEMEAQTYWLAGDRDGYIQSRIRTRTAAGLTPTKSLASRWYNLMSILSLSQGDTWIHSDTEFVWWTTSTSSEAPTFEPKLEPVGRRRSVIICHKPCEPWSRTNTLGNALPWAGLHPKAKDFLSTEATFQALSPEKGAYALALIRGENLSPWHETEVWRRKLAESKTQAGATIFYDQRQKAAWRMANTAFTTTANANGQQILKNVKNKDMEFGSPKELEDYILDLLSLQSDTCVLSDLPLNLDEKSGDPEMRASLDRIDSSGHYGKGNIQIVCRFANRWKGAGDNDEFCRLMDVVMRVPVRNSANTQ
jgi:hypothetical protein